MKGFIELAAHDRLVAVASAIEVYARRPEWSALPPQKKVAVVHPWLPLPASPPQLPRTA
jgi:hypothetical protein